jgi:hypothetical protein
MNKKLFFAVMLIIALVFGMTVLGCGGEEEDTWSKVTKLSQVNGTWKAPPQATANFSGFKMTAKYNNYTMTFNAAAETMTANGSSTITLSGKGIDEFWPYIKEVLMGEMEREMEGVTVTADDTKHSITTTYDNSSLSVTDEELAEAGFLINQNKKKLKVGVQAMEVIYTKQ